MGGYGRCSHDALAGHTGQERVSMHVVLIGLGQAGLLWVCPALLGCTALDPNPNPSS